MITKNMNKTVKKLVFESGDELIVGIGYYKGFSVVQGEDNEVDLVNRLGVPIEVKIQTVRNINRAHYQALADIAAEKAINKSKKDELEKMLLELKQDYHTLDNKASEVSKHIKGERALDLIKKGKMGLEYFSRQLNEVLDNIADGYRAEKATWRSSDNAGLIYNLTLLHRKDSIQQYNSIKFLHEYDDYDSDGLEAEFCNNHLISYKFDDKDEYKSKSITSFVKELTEYLDTDILELDLYAEHNRWDRSVFGGVKVGIKNTDIFDLFETEHILHKLSSVKVKN